MKQKEASMADSKIIYLTKNVHDLVKEYPELIPIMKELGFTRITEKTALNTLGRFMTIPKGAMMMHIDMGKVISTLMAHGFTLGGSFAQAPEEKPAPAETAPDERTARITEYIRRLSAGEDLEKVRADFVKHFKDVDPGEIALAEQSLLKGGVPLRDVQRLCDVHSALFHGATRAEKIAAAEAKVQESLGRFSPAALERKDGADGLYETLRAIPGHPLSILSLENEAIASRLEKVRKALDTGENLMDELAALRRISFHYNKKNVLYPILKMNYGFSGPSDVMWSVDDEIRDTLRNLEKRGFASPAVRKTPQWQERLSSALTRAEEMIYKENNILFPLCAKNFKEEEWKAIARDFSHMEPCLTGPQPRWQEAFPKEKEESSLSDGIIHLPTGRLTVKELTALLNTLPFEITFVDAHDINRYWNDDGAPKLFSRPTTALGREVYTCHPPKVVPMVKNLIDSFRTGKQNLFDVWMEKEGEPVLVRYMAVRDAKGTFVGTLEIVQKMGFAKEHFVK